jgi:hypothetical protein
MTRQIQNSYRANFSPCPAPAVIELLERADTISGFDSHARLLTPQYYSCLAGGNIRTLAFQPGTTRQGESISN